MPTLRKEITLAGGATNSNAIADEKFVQPPFNAAMALYIVQDGATAAGDVTCDVSTGNSIEIDAAAVPTVATGTGPDRNTALLGSWVSRAQDRIQIKLHNGGAATSNIRFLLEIRPL